MRMSMKFAVLVLAAACAKRPAPPQSDLAPKVDAEIARIAALHASLAKADLPKEFAGELDRYAPLIESARKAKSPTYRLYRLRAPFGGVESIAYVAKQKDAAANMAALESLWKAEKSRFQRSPAAGDRPLLARALIESATNRAEKLYDASVTYGRITSPLFGLYYLAEAEASLKYAQFVSSIEFGGRDEAVPAPATLRASADALQRDMLAGFERDANGRNMVAASSRMKEAREMLDGKRFAGASLALLETRLEIDRQTKSAGAPRPAVAREGSLAELWSAVASEHEDELTRSIVASNVLPLLDAFAQPAPRSENATARANVAVTLVRWPYT